MSVILSTLVKETDHFPSVSDRVTIAKNIIKINSINPDGICAVFSTGIDYYTQPPDAIVISGSIRAENALCASINDSCCSTLTAIDISKNLLRNERGGTALIVSSSIFGEIQRLHKCTAQANGIGAVLLSNATGGLRIVGSKHKTAHTHFGLKTIEPSFAPRLRYGFIEKRESPEWQAYTEDSKELPPSIMNSLLCELGLRSTEIQHWIFHASPVRAAWERRLGVNERIISPNMGPLTCLNKISSLYKTKSIEPGDYVGILEIGLGMSISAMILRESK